MKEKSCSTCKIVKSFEEFGKHSKAKNGKRTQCKSCEAEYRLRIKLTNIVIQTKICSTCKVDKEVSEFNKNVSQKDGYCNRCRSCCTKHYRENTVRILDRNFNYRKNNKDKLSKINSIKYKETYSTILGKLSINISNLIRRRVKNGRDSIGFKEILGCSVKEFKNYIESQFLPWMSWENHGNVCEKLVYNCSWDLDHIIPLYIAKTEEELKTLNHWSNFQPLCSRINRADKNKKVYPVTNLELKITINNKHKQTNYELQKLFD